MPNADELYNALLNSGLTELEVKNEIEKKERQYGGHLTSEALLFVIAKERGLNLQFLETKFEFDNHEHEELDYSDFEKNIVDLSEETNNIVVLGRIETIYGIKEFTRKDGTSGIVGTFILKDKTGKIKVVLWDRQTDIMRSDYFKRDEILRIVGGYVKKGFKEDLEIYLKKNTFLQLAPKDVKPTEIPTISEVFFSNAIDKNNPTRIKKLLEKEGFYGKVRGFVKIEEFTEKDLKSGEKSFLFRFFLCNNTERIEVVVWGMKAVEWFKLLENDDEIFLTNILIKRNEYNGLNQVKITKKSDFKKI